MNSNQITKNDNQKNVSKLEPSEDVAKIALQPPVDIDTDPSGVIDNDSLDVAGAASIEKSLDETGIENACLDDEACEKVLYNFDIGSFLASLPPITPKEQFKVWREVHNIYTHGPDYYEESEEESEEEPDEES